MFKKILRKLSVKAESPTDDKAIIHAALLEARRQRELSLPASHLEAILLLETKYQAYLMGRMI